MDGELQRAEQIRPQLREWRRQLHRIPELGMELPKTIGMIEGELEKMEIPYRALENGAGILAWLGQGERMILLRSDMDALPIREESGEEFASENGNMHACGHDMHAAILLGAARLLKEEEAALKGRVLLLFQSGEETLEGAREVVRQGVLDGVDAAFAMHVASQLPVGVMMCGEHPMSSSTNFSIVFHGRGGHGSMPELCVDPINAGVQAYLAFQELIARECGGSDEVVLTIGQFQAGSAANVIPERAVLQGTMRTFDRKKRESLMRRIGEILEGIDRMCRVTHTMEILSSVDDVVCDRKLNSIIAEGIRSLSGSFQVLDRFHVMGSEDFACISQHVPSSYIGLGAAVDAPGKCFGQHNPKVRFAEECLPIGAASYVKAAKAFLEYK